MVANTVVAEEAGHGLSKHQRSSLIDLKASLASSMTGPSPFWEVQPSSQKSEGLSRYVERVQQHRWTVGIQIHILGDPRPISVVKILYHSLHQCAYHSIHLYRDITYNIHTSATSLRSNVLWKIYRGLISSCIWEWEGVEVEISIWRQHVFKSTTVLKRLSWLVWVGSNLQC